MYDADGYTYFQAFYGYFKSLLNKVVGVSSLQFMGHFEVRVLGEADACRGLMKSDAIVLLQPRADAGLGLIERCRQTAIAASG